MMQRFRHVLLGLAMMLALVSGGPTAAAAAGTSTPTNISPIWGAQWMVADLGRYVYPEAINNPAQVTGFARFTDSYNNTRIQPFVWQNGTMHGMGTLTGLEGYGHAINNAGWAVGEMFNYSGGPGLTPFLWLGNWFGTLDTLPGDIESRAYGINASNVVVGLGTDGRREHATLWQSGRPTKLPFLPGYTYTSEARAINDAGQVAGSSASEQTFTLSHAFAWQNGYLQDLSPGLTTYSGARAINKYGQVVGWLGTSGPTLAWLWKIGSSVSVDLGVLPGVVFASGTGINSATQVVGVSQDTGNPPTLGTHMHPFQWQGGTMRNMNSLLLAGSGWVLKTATSINDAGQIVGLASHNGEDDHGYLLTPPQPPVVYCC
jgi:probable HAF family extracellular repeat protein